MFEKKEKKDIIDKEKIKDDLLKIQREKLKIIFERRVGYIVYGCIISLMLFLFACTILPDIRAAKMYYIFSMILAHAFALFSIYHIIMLVYSLFFGKYRKELREIKEYNFKVYEDVLKKIETVQIYEPHGGWLGGEMRIYQYKNVTMYHFYPRSVRTYGIKNCSSNFTGLHLEGDECYVVMMNSDHRLIHFYNKKFFDFKE